MTLNDFIRRVQKDIAAGKVNGEQYMTVHCEAEFHSVYNYRVVTNDSDLIDLFDAGTIVIDIMKTESD